MAMSCTITERGGYPLRRVKMVVVSAADGSASGTTVAKYNGEVVRFVAVPDGGGTQPSDQFDIALNDGDGYDILAGVGANLSNAAPTTKVASMGAICSDTITLAATNLGAAKGVTLYLYLR